MVARPAPHEVIDATRDDDPVLAGVLARAFADDPLVNWLVPPGRGKHERMIRFFLSELDSYHRRGRVITTTERAAASLWAPPDRWRTPPLDVLRSAPRLLRAFGLRSITGLRVLTAMERIHPEEPHWYLGIVGADPARQGTGAGAAVIATVLDECDEQGLPAYLESSKPDNVPYYERFHFTVTGEVSAAGSPTLIPMWRDPQPPA